MPLCNSPLHAASTLPANLPVAAFYRRNATHLYGLCKHCFSLRARLRRQYGHTSLPVHLVRAAWRVYWKQQRQRDAVRAAPLGMRWCRSGHYAPLREFRPVIRGRRCTYCRDCHSIRQIQYRTVARWGRELSWPDASLRHFRATVRATRQRNETAPPGQRWCSHCQQYFVVPPQRQYQISVSVCMACRRLAQRGYYARKKAAGAMAPAAD